MKIKYIAALFFLSSLVSCSKYLDVNHDPNTVLDVDPKLLFSFAATSLINNRAGGDLYIPMALGGQSIAGGGNSSSGYSWGSGAQDQYVFFSDNYRFIWTQFYTSVAANLKQAIVLAETGIPVNNNGAAQAKVLLAETFYELTTIYGDIPFSEALNEAVKAPKFDSQQEVINGTIALIDEALKQFEPGNTLSFSGNYDLFYQGEIDQWIRAAKSLKLRMLMTMVDKDASKTALIGQMVQQGGMIASAADNLKVAFEATAGKQNPKYSIINEFYEGVEFFYASPYVVDPMVAVNDPRLPLFFDKPDGAADYVGIQPGADADDDVHAKIAGTLHTATQPEYLFTYQEQLFFEAEVYARGLGVTADLTKANTLYKKAIEESGKFWGLEPAVAADFARGLADLSALSEPVKAIHLQHWVDEMDRGLEAFTQWRRSGAEGNEVPALTLPAFAPPGPLFRRFEYPSTSETSANPNAPSLPVEFTEKMWFDL